MSLVSKNIQDLYVQISDFIGTCLSNIKIALGFLNQLLFQTLKNFHIPSPHLHVCCCKIWTVKKFLNSSVMSFFNYLCMNCRIQREINLFSVALEERVISACWLPAWSSWINDLRIPSSAASVIKVRTWHLSTSSWLLCPIWRL